MGTGKTKRAEVCSLAGRSPPPQFEARRESEQAKLESTKEFESIESENARCRPARSGRLSARLTTRSPQLRLPTRERLTTSDCLLQNALSEGVGLPAASRRVSQPTTTMSERERERKRKTFEKRLRTDESRLGGHRRRNVQRRIHEGPLPSQAWESSSLDRVGFEAGVELATFTMASHDYSGLVIFHWCKWQFAAHSSCYSVSSAELTGKHWQVRPMNSHSLAAQH